MMGETEEENKTSENLVDKLSEVLNETGKNSSEFMRAFLNEVNEQ